jgi:repressor LexA
MTQPTESQTRALNFLRDYQSTHGFPPTRREMAEGLQYKSGNGAQEMLKRLERLGLITMEDNQARSICVTPDCPLEALAQRNVERTHAILLGEAEAHANTWLAEMIGASESAQFLVRHLPFVKAQIGSIYERTEGAEKAEIKCAAAIRILTQTFLPLEENAEQNVKDLSTATGKTFRSQSELFRFFDAIMDMYKGSGARYFEFIRNHAPTKKTLRSDLGSRHQFHTTPQTDTGTNQSVKQSAHCHASA